MALVPRLVLASYLLGMPSPYYVNVSIHVLAALVWLGGMFFLGLVGAPVLRGVEPPELRQRLFDQLGMRFRSVGWTALVVLIITGITNLHFRGLLSVTILTDPRFMHSTWGRALAVKLAALAVMLVVEGYHDWVLGPRAGRVMAGSPEALELRRRANLYARVSGICGIVIVLAAVRLARG
jgi:putative copper resistance protein D